MSAHLAIINIFLAIVLNVLLTAAAVSYQTIGTGLHPGIAGLIGATVTIVVLAAIAYTGVRKDNV